MGGGVGDRGGVNARDTKGKTKRNRNREKEGRDELARTRPSPPQLESYYINHGQCRGIDFIHSFQLRHRRVFFDRGRQDPASTGFICPNPQSFFMALVLVRNRRAGLLWEVVGKLHVNFRLRWLSLVAIKYKDMSDSKFQ